jgi:hypothetical protein
VTLTHDLNRLMLHALGLLALTGCSDKDDTATEPLYEGNYGDCDPATIDALDTTPPSLDWDESAELLACDRDQAVTEGDCMAYESTSLLVANDVGSGNDVSDVICGPMWLDDLCCVHVEIEGEDEDTVGRPFLVDGAARTAVLTRRDDWSLPSESAPIPPALREALVRYWARAGLAEHASVAAFARFSMALLHLGAPPRLVVDTHQAALDEVRHAQLCFGLASRYAGIELGPGPLDVAASLEGELDPERVFETLFEEGCVGETLAALEAAQAARRARDPEVRQVLERIAEDEQRHAELAWRSARWLVSRHPELQATLARLACALEPPPMGDAPDALAVHGCLGAAERRRVKALGLREVVTPLVQALRGTGDALAAEA